MERIKGGNITYVGSSVKRRIKKIKHLSNKLC